jgi:site-specific DNA-methyltransferase (adenine-specific)
VKKNGQTRVDEARLFAGQDLPRRRTIAGTSNRAVVHGARARNNGRYNGNGREWGTPWELYQPLDVEFGFTVDACATAENTKSPWFWTEAQNGLLQDWRGQRVWMNPPYGREIYAWTRKARDSRAEVVVGLLPASTDLAWWHEDVVGHASEIRYLRGRVRFLTDGPYLASGFFASLLVIWKATHAVDPVGRKGQTRPRATKNGSV